MDQIVLEVVKALLIAAIGVIAKMHKDISRLRCDVNAAHKKLRELERLYDDRDTFEDSGRSGH